MDDSGLRRICQFMVETNHGPTLSTPGDTTIVDLRVCFAPARMRLLNDRHTTATTAYQDRVGAYRVLQEDQALQANRIHDNLSP